MKKTEAELRKALGGALEGEALENVISTMRANGQIAESAEPSADLLANFDSLFKAKGKAKDEEFEWEAYVEEDEDGIEGGEDEPGEFEEEEGDEDEMVKAITENTRAMRKLAPELKRLKSENAQFRSMFKAMREAVGTIATQALAKGGSNVEERLAALEKAAGMPRGDYRAVDGRSVLPVAAPGDAQPQAGAYLDAEFLAKALQDKAREFERVNDVVKAQEARQVAARLTVTTPPDQLQKAAAFFGIKH